MFQQISKNSQIPPWFPTWVMIQNETQKKGFSGWLPQTLGLYFWLQGQEFLGVFGLHRHLHILQGHKLRRFYLGCKLGKNAAFHCNPPLQFGNWCHSPLRHWPTLQIPFHLRKAQSTRHKISLVKDNIESQSDILIQEEDEENTEL